MLNYPLNISLQFLYFSFQNAHLILVFFYVHAFSLDPWEGAVRYLYSVLEYLGLSTSSSSWFQLSVNADSERQQMMAQSWDSATYSETSIDFQVLALASGHGSSLALMGDGGVLFLSLKHTNT